MEYCTDNPSAGSQGGVINNTEAATDISNNNNCQENMEDGMTDLERLQAKANAVTDDSLDSTRRMMAMMEDVSMNTMTKLLSMIMIRGQTNRNNSAE